MLVIDTECYKNYFLVSFKQLSTGKVRHYEMYPGKALDVLAIAGTLAAHTTISFNGIHYDLLTLTAAVKHGYNNEKLHKLSTRIITTSAKSWEISRDLMLNVPKTWDHIDLFEVAPGRVSLKIYGGRLGAPKLQDLPIDPSDLITEGLRPLMRSYCENDLDTTELLYLKVKKAVDLRVAMSAQYGIDLRSKSDAQIAEAIIKSELTKITGDKYKPIKFKQDATFRYRDPEIVDFKSLEIQEVFDRILKTRFELGANGALKLPAWLKSTKIKIGSGAYKMGIGGLHSTESAQLIEANGEDLFELDVTSYYPYIILQQKLAPRSMGGEFLKLYQSLVSRRLAAKKSGDKVTADTLKIVLNGSFGKLGSKYSALYAPALLLQTTLTGQLSLLMLIEMLEDAGIRVYSANTDGVVVKVPKDKRRDLETVSWAWQIETSFPLERTDYRLLASRDVNNYLAIKPDGSVKGKGIFAKTGIAKNPNRSIVFEAVSEFLKTGASIQETIRRSDDLNKFVTVRRVTGGAVWRGERLGKAVRYYSSSEVGAGECIEYLKNSNKVPMSSGCRPAMDIGKFPEDVDFDKYIEEAFEVLAGVGYNGPEIPEEVF